MDNRPVVIMAQDELRFGRISDARTCWALNGVRPGLAKQIVRSFVYVYVAVCVALWKMTSLILPHANTEMMNLFLGEVSKDFKDCFVIMLVDGAGSHRSGRLQLPENIRIVYQRSYRPELNPVEHLWDELRENYLPNMAFRSLNAFEKALVHGLRELCNAPERLRSMTKFEYLAVTF